MFTNVQIFPAITKGHLIQWTMLPGVPEGSTISILRSKSGVSWEHLADVKDTYFFIDSTFDPKAGFDVNYKLVLNDTHEYVVTSYIAALPKKDRNIIRALRRRETLLQAKGGGRLGGLLKRRVDEKCTLCNGVGGDTGCVSCYGTGFSGGFYRPVVYNVLTVNSQLNRTRKTTPVGTYSSSKDVTRGLVYPTLDEGDVWVEKFTDRRYWITGRTELTYRGVPIIYSNIEMSLIPPLSKVYDIEVNNI